MVAERDALRVVRPTTGWPVLTTETIAAIALENRAIAMTEMVSDTTTANTCMLTPRCADPS